MMINALVAPYPDRKHFKKYPDGEMPKCKEFDTWAYRRHSLV